MRGDFREHQHIIMTSEALNLIFSLIIQSKGVNVLSVPDTKHGKLRKAIKITAEDIVDITGLTCAEVEGLHNND